MIPYLIINGVSSRDIDGLLIQSLPPISKPKMRTSKEEIDGRDGDIITPLGFSAYDKTITIGLKGDYNVDDVINYFNTSGRITFSNELDKYYNFACYDTIDFEKLIRFKTAKVKLHVQPFKYSIDEPPIVENIESGETVNTITVRNTGNINSRPKVTLTGSGSVTLRINGKLVLSMTLDDDQTIIFDNMNATDPQGNYINRQVTGDYNDLAFHIGKNTITITGMVSHAQLENYSRWI